MLIMKQRIIATANSVVTRFEAPPVKRRPELVVGKYYRKGKPLSARIDEDCVVSTYSTSQSTSILGAYDSIVWAY